MKIEDSPIYGHASHESLNRVYGSADIIWDISTKGYLKILAYFPVSQLFGFRYCKISSNLTASYILNYMHWEKTPDSMVKYVRGLAFPGDVAGFITAFAKWMADNAYGVEENWEE